MPFISEPNQKIKLFARSDKFIYLLIALLIARILINVYGFDVVPFLSNNDEAIIQDQSYYLYQQGVFKALSFDGQLIDHVGACHPPLFLWLQTGVFHLLGFNAAALRLPSILYSICSIIITLFTLHLIGSSGLSSRLYARIVSLIVLLDPTYLSWSRFGRNDTLANFCLSAGILLFFLSYSLSVNAASQFKSEPAENVSVSTTVFFGLALPPSCILVASSIFVGLAISSHVQAVYGYLFFIACLLAVGRFYHSASTTILSACIPALVFLMLWIVAFSDNIPLSVSVFNTIQSSFQGSQNWISSLQSMIGPGGDFNPQKFAHVGGTLLVLNVFAYILAFGCVCIAIINKVWQGSTARIAGIDLFNFRSRKVLQISLDNWLWLGVGAFALQLVLIYTKYGIATSRFYGFYPVTVLLIPILAEWISTTQYKAFFRRIVSGLLAFMLVINISLFASYAKLVKERSDAHRYEQIESIVDNLKDSVASGVAVPPLFWFAALNKLPGKNIMVIENGFKVWEAFDLSEKYNLLRNSNLDMLILPRFSRLSSRITSENGPFQPSGQNFKALGSEYIVYKRQD